MLRPVVGSLASVLASVLVSRFHEPFPLEALSAFADGQWGPVEWRIFAFGLAVGVILGILLGVLLDLLYLYKQLLVASVRQRLATLHLSGSPWRNA